MRGKRRMRGNDKMEDKDERKEMDAMNEKDEREGKDEREDKDMWEMKAVRKEDFNAEENVRGKENIMVERNTKGLERRRENIDNGSAAGDAIIWTRTNETGVTRKAWKVLVTSTTRTGGATKNMQAHNALLIYSGKKDNRSRKVKSESNTTQTRK